jgi:uncharacterized oligopeptide transporter (OPT) family protein
MIGNGHWIEWMLYAAGLVGTIYTWQVMIPRLRTFLPQPDPEERAAELLRRYHERKTNEGSPEQ